MFRRVERAIKVAEEGWESESSDSEEYSDDSNIGEDESDLDSENLSDLEDKIEKLEVKLNEIESAKSKLSCQICDKMIFKRSEDLDAHLLGKKHKKRLAAIEKELNESKENKQGESKKELLENEVSKTQGKRKRKKGPSSRSRREMRARAKARWELEAKANKKKMASEGDNDKSEKIDKRKVKTSKGAKNKDVDKEAINNKASDTEKYLINHEKKSNRTKESKLDVPKLSKKDLKIKEAQNSSEQVCTKKHKESQKNNILEKHDKAKGLVENKIEPIFKTELSKADKKSKLNTENKKEKIKENNSKSSKGNNDYNKIKSKKKKIKA